MSAAAAAAAAARRRREQEEEEVTLMNTDPSGAVEYKIIRSATGAFKDPAKFRAALDEEARAGWELVEKLDNSRARLRRSTECRKRDAGLGQRVAPLERRPGIRGHARRAIRFVARSWRRPANIPQGKRSERLCRREHE